MFHNIKPLLFTTHSVNYKKFLTTYEFCKQASKKIFKRSCSASPNLLLDRLNLCCAKGKFSQFEALVIFVCLYDQTIFVQSVSPFMEFCCIYDTVACCFSCNGLCFLVFPCVYKWCCYFSDTFYSLTVLSLIPSIPKLSSQIGRLKNSQLKEFLHSRNLLSEVSII